MALLCVCFGENWHCSTLPPSSLGQRNEETWKKVTRESRAITAEAGEREHCDCLSWLFAGRQDLAVLTLWADQLGHILVFCQAESFQGLWPGFLAVQPPILSHHQKGSWAAAPAPCCFEQTSSAHNCHALPFGLGLCQVKPEPCTSSDEQNPARHFAFLQSEVVAVALCQCIVKSCSFITKPIQFYINWCIYRD